MEIEITPEMFVESIGNDEDLYKCSRCGYENLHYFLFDKFRYCPKCGSEIKWRLKR
jgi:hypothetical protein